MEEFDEEKEYVESEEERIENEEFDLYIWKIPKMIAKLKKYKLQIVYPPIRKVLVRLQFVSVAKQDEYLKAISKQTCVRLIFLKKEFKREKQKRSV